MSNEPLFDNLKSKLEDLRPAYDQSDWDKMEQMLDRRKRPAAMWLWRAAAGMAVLVATIFGLYLFIQNDNAAIVAESAHTATFQLDIDNISTATQMAPAPSGKEAAAEEHTGRQHDPPASRAIDYIEKEQPAEIQPSDNTSGYSSKQLANNSSQGEDKAAGTSAEEQNASKELPPLGSSLLLRKKKLTSISNNTQMAAHPAAPDDRSAGIGRNTVKIWAGPSIKPSLQFVQNTQGAFGEGVTAGLDMRNGLGMESGIYYEQLKYRESPSASLALGEAHLRSHGKFKGLSIPLRVNYRFNTGRIVQPIVQAGVTAFLPLKSEYVFEYDNTSQSGGSVVQTEQSSVKDTLTITNNSRPVSVDQNATTNYYNQGNYHYLPVQSNQLYLMANAGAGVRVFASSKLSFQLTANYGLPLSGIGIEDRHLSQVDMGVAMQYYIN